MTIKRITNISAAYLAIVKDEVIDVDASGGTITVTLPTAALGKKIRYEVKDTGSCGTNNITVVGEGNETLDGAASYVMNVNYQSITFTPNGTRTAWQVS